MKCTEALDLVEVRLAGHPQILEGFAFLLDDLETIHGNEHFYVLQGVSLLHPFPIIPVSKCVKSGKLRARFSHARGRKPVWLALSHQRNRRLITTFRMRQAPGFGWSLVSAILGIAAGIVLLLWPL